MPFTVSGTAICAICGDYATGWSKGQLVCPKHGGGDGPVLTREKIEYEEKQRNIERLEKRLEKLKMEEREKRRKYHLKRKIELAKEIVASSKGVHRKINERWLKCLESTMKQA